MNIPTAWPLALQSYCAFQHQRLVQAIAYAKAWNVIEFLSMDATGDVAQTHGIPTLIQKLPDWIAMISNLLTPDS